MLRARSTNPKNVPVTTLKALNKDVLVLKITVFQLYIKARD